MQVSYAKGQRNFRVYKDKMGGNGTRLLIVNQGVPCAKSVGSKLLYRLGTHLKSFATITFIPSPSGRMLSVRMPRFLLYGVLVVVAAGVLYAGVYVSGAIMANQELRRQMLSSESRLQELLQENVRLKKDCESRDKIIKGLTEKTERLAEDLDRLEEFAGDIRGLLSTPSVSSRLPSRGGITRDMRSRGNMSGSQPEGPKDLEEQGDSPPSGKTAGADFDVLSKRAAKLESELVLLKRVTAVYAEKLSRVPVGWPARGTVTSRFGYRNHPITRSYAHHDGVDIAMPRGTPVRATAKGNVEFAGWQSGYGYVVVLAHGNGYETIYGHNSRLVVKTGQQVAEGQVIAYSGSTGSSTGPHLHYEVRREGRAIDPTPYLRRLGIR